MDSLLVLCENLEGGVNDYPPISPCRGPPAWAMLDQTVEIDPIHPELEYDFDQSVSW